MLGNKTRQIRALKSRNAKLADRCADLTRERDAAVRLNGRLAQKTTAATEHADRAAHAWGLVVKDANRAESLFYRAMRAGRAESRRLRRVIDEQQRQLGEKEAANASLAERLAKFEGPDRALGLARPVGDDAASQIADLQRRLAARTAQLLALEDERALLQRANEAADWAAGPATRLQAAS